MATANAVSKPLVSLGSLLGTPPGTHRWTFFRAGGLDQVKLENADDLRHLGQLDQKLWVALSCPVKGLEFDARTLELLDADRDGRVRVPEILNALRWCCKVLKDPAELLGEPAALPLASLNEADEEGRSLLASARQILANLGRPDAPSITVEEAGDTARIFSETTFNGDGVVQAACAHEAGTKQAIEDIIACLGGEPDRSGKPGVGKAKADAFFAECAAYAAWYAEGEAGSAPGRGALPLGAATSRAWSAFIAVRAKIEDWFTRCRLAAYDTRAGGLLNRSEADLSALASQDLSGPGPAVEGLPLQQVTPTGILSFGAGLNPAWIARLQDFRTLALEPLLGSGTATLDLPTWERIKASLAPHESWLAAKRGVQVERLGLERIRVLLAGDAQARLHALIEEDQAVAPRVTAIDAVERLARFHRHLGLLLRNFVNFADFYDRRPPPPIFICGTLFLDQRSFDLCIRVEDANAHAALANLARIFIAYIACSRASGEKMTVAVGVTQGDSDQLMVGRNGVFYDRKGRDWDATVIKLLEHPISIRQALWSPYRKIGKMIGDTIERIAGDADKTVMSKAQTQVATSAQAVAAGKPGEKPKLDTGMLAAIGIAATSLAGAVSGIAAAILGLPLWKVPLVVLGVMAVVSGPSMIIAYLKLRQRTLGPVLEANGWAINGRVRINMPLGHSLSTLKSFPAGSRRQLNDPFADERTARRRRLLLLSGILVLVAGAGFITWTDSWGRVGSWLHQMVAVEPTKDPAGEAVKKP